LAAQKAYAPYSNFSVGAAIRTASGHILSGCNVENAAYPAGTCAEAGAIAAMIAAGETTISDIAIVGVKSNPCYPCGACRQRIFEFANRSTRVHLRDGVTGKSITHSVDELLPHAFGPRDLA
jgi:cytidine deaminase